MMEYEDDSFDGDKPTGLKDTIGLMIEAYVRL
jgi:hypothetical protein